MAPRLHQHTIHGGQRGALPIHCHHREDNHLDSIEGSSSSTFTRQSLHSEQQAEAYGHAAQTGRRSLRKSTTSLEMYPQHQKTNQMKALEKEDEDIDIWVLDSDVIWTCVPDRVDPNSPILYTPVGKPRRTAIDAGVVATKAPAFPIQDEAPNSDDENEK